MAGFLFPVVPGWSFIIQSGAGWQQFAGCWRQLQIRKRGPGSPARFSVGRQIMKRSRRVVLQWIGTAAVGGVSAGFVPRDCVVRRTPDTPGLARQRLPNCEVVYGGFGRTPHFFPGTDAHHRAGG
jgi:hypothetical protein